MNTVDLSVYITNIPPNVNEDELANIFRKYGDVTRIRMVKEGGKATGSAFCDYTNSQSPQIAIRSLDGYELKGQRIRVSKPSAQQIIPLQRSQSSSSLSTTAGAFTSQGSAGLDIKQQKHIDNALSQFTIGEIYDVLEEIKNMIESEPDKARSLLTEKPMLTQAILKAMIHMGQMRTRLTHEGRYPIQMFDQQQQMQMQQQGYDPNRRMMPGIPYGDPRQMYPPGIPMPPMGQMPPQHPMYMVPPSYPYQVPSHPGAIPPPYQQAPPMPMYGRPMIPMGMPLMNPNTIQEDHTKRQ